MLSVLVANTKGGCGKTTIATHLAAAFAAGGLPTALADLDRQRSSLGWLRRRPDWAAPIAGLDWVKQIGEPTAGTARLVVDMPAAMRMKAVRQLVRSADIILVPVLPSVFDEDTTGAFIGKLERLKPIRKAGKGVVLIRNRVRDRSRAAAHLDSFLAGLGHKVAARVPDRAIYPEVAARGLSLFDLQTRQAAALRADWFPLLRFIESLR